MITSQRRNYNLGERN